MKCDICGMNQWQEGTILYKCKSCGFVRAADRFFETDLDQVYSGKYYKGTDYFNYELEGSSLKKNFKNRLEIIKNYVPPSKKLLEVGSAYGFFLELAKDIYECSGIERNPEVAKKVSNRLSLEVSGGPFLDMPVSNETYDLVVSLDTIEHVPSPRKFVEKIASLLKPEGYVFLETGNIDAFLPRIRKESWRLIYPPEHLSYLSARILSKLLQETGFEVQEIINVPFCRSFAQIVYKLSPKTFNSLPNKAQRKLANFSISINTGDLMFLVAKKYLLK